MPQPTDLTKEQIITEVVAAIDFAKKEGYEHAADFLIEFLRRNYNVHYMNYTEKKQ